MKDYSDLVIKIRYRDIPEAGLGLRGMVSNGDRYGPSLMVAKSTHNLHYMAKCHGDKVTSFHLPSQVNKTYLIVHLSFNIYQK